MAHGKTLLMRAIRRPGPQYIHRHVGAPRWVRRNKRSVADWNGSYIDNQPYVTGSRDLRKGRKLRGDR